jgi:CxxC-x17-CxxC domain-containing protein
MYIGVFLKLLISKNIEYNSLGKEIMMSYNRNSRSGGGRYGGGGFRGPDSGRREMHKAVCDECGKGCEVPFRPTGDKPIYCSDCFEKRGGGSSKRSSRRGSGGSGFGERDNTNKQLLNEVSSLNTKLDRILKVLEGSVEKKPVSKKLKVKKVVKKATSKGEEIKTKKASKKESEKSTPQ